MLRRVLKPVLQAVIVLLFLFLGLQLVVMAYPPAGTALGWLGSARERQCTVADTMRSAAYRQEYPKALERIMASTRMVRQEGNLQLWDVPGMRQFWLQGKLSKLSAIVFAEQAAGEYWHPSVHFQPGDIVLDVGADYGSVSWAALHAGAQKVAAIEIDPGKWPCLERTFAKEIGENRVAIVKAGAWDRESTLELSGDRVTQEGEGKNEGPRQTVRVTTIDQIVAELQLPRVDFIVMDIEGAEKPALRGAANTIRKFRPRMAIALEHRAEDITEIPQTVGAIASGYDVICGQCALVGQRLVAQVMWFK